MASDVPNAGWAAAKVPEASIQKTVNWFASAIHEADSSAQVTTGAWTFQACNGPFRRDQLLLERGASERGRHGERHPRLLRGPLLRGQWHRGANPTPNASTFWHARQAHHHREFSAQRPTELAANDVYTKLFSNTYKGAWAWQYTQSSGDAANSDWPAMKVPMHEPLQRGDQRRKLPVRSAAQLTRATLLPAGPSAPSWCWAWMTAAIWRARRGVIARPCSPRRRPTIPWRPPPPIRPRPRRSLLRRPSPRRVLSPRRLRRGWTSPP